MVNTLTTSESFAFAHQVLDQGLQKILTLCEEMQSQLETNFAGRLELLDLQRVALAGVITPATCRLYRQMAITMFEVLQILQPEDFEDDASVNLYFWPGYHSYLTNKRIFCQLDGAEFLGVGVCGNGCPAVYHDSCHARWYRLALTPFIPSFSPASAYHWFEWQRPGLTDKPHDIIASLNLTVDPRLRSHGAFPEHKIATLPNGLGSSLEWGEEVAKLINGLGYLKNTDWQFPDRLDLEDAPGFNRARDAELRSLRLYLLSLWLHGAFRTDRPEWWDKLIDELEKQQLPELLTAVTNTASDTVGCDWGDRSTERPPFSTLTTICFHPLIAPSPTPIVGPMELARAGRRRSATDERNIGWATLLCSKPLGLPFVSLIRDWLDKIYGTLRNTEVSLVLRHREPLERAAQMVTMLSHEMNTFVHYRLEPMLLLMDDHSSPAIESRIFDLMCLQELIYLTYGLTSVAPQPAKVADYKARFIRALAIDREMLKDILLQAARDVQSYHSSGDGARVKMAKPTRQIDRVKSLTTYVPCLLLVGEMVQNYCKHAEPGTEAVLSMDFEEDNLLLVLEGVTRQVPAGMSFALLHSFLDGLRLGEATLARDGVKCTWRVRVSLS